MTITAAPRQVADGAVRLALRLAFRLLKLWWRWRRPRYAGAVVALWCRGRILLVEHSYRPGWGMPGGGVGRDEAPQAAARREVAEELGLRLAPEQLSLACIVEDDWLGRRETVHIYEAKLDEEPAIVIDNREIIAAEFVAAEAAARRDLPPHAYQYLGQRSAATPV